MSGVNVAVIYAYHCRHAWEWMADPMKTLAGLAQDLATGATSSRRLVEECLARISAPAGEGQRVFLKVHAEAARAAAEYHDRMRKFRAQLAPWAGIPVSIKDLFDMAGDVTTAGSKILRDQPAAGADAVVVARLRAAGFIPIGRTNMTEFAYSGVGLNPHYGTPLNPFERERGRIPGGSSSGAAISITDQMAYGALGTDTGGSCRVPAAFCGIVGFKPTAQRVPLAGAFPLSTSLDSAGPLAASVACCATLDAVLAAQPHAILESRTLRQMRFAVPQSYVLDDLDPHVARSFARALSVLAGADANITEIPFTELRELSDINRKGGFSAAESYALHRERIAAHESQYDPRVLVRILRGREQSAADYIDLLGARADLQQRVDVQIARFDAVLMPTTPMIAPTLGELESDAEYGRLNMLALRNPVVANFLDRCAISIPCQEPGTAPVGLMMMGARNADRNLLALAAAVESLLATALPPP
jgi:aspartyl-tRNA(Asn)/glutamyl-tRNA(Gln) amidotransferase subunit A